ncbi:aldehyde dehydrogenase [Daedalea quercina L-15889]|uniref:Aldehyde dehydrogenase n=1 Tax=Daedalea quercina L-15889 TaxID=1314783 RepID=A0A165ME75_9APHY|nr:aldehyde dehydrogenase [Daedalea quercina L-15889]
MANILSFTPIDEIPKIHHELKEAFQTGKTRPIAYRRQQLLQLCYLLQDNLERFYAALYADLGRPREEATILECSGTLLEIKDAYDHVEKWAKTEKSPFNLLWWTLSPQTRKEPKGVILIISPFNYPVYLTLCGLASAIAAGNVVMLKPSELSPATAALLAELMPRYVDPDLVRIVNGGVPETKKILELPFDHILYTGNNRVAKIICTAAAQHLTPVTLELGGKSPCVIDPSCNAQLAAKRIWWGKLLNSGQLCLSPDYVLVPEFFQDQFVKVLEEVYCELHPTDPKTSGQMARIVNERHTKRLKQLLDDTKGTVVFGGTVDIAAKYVAPTLVKNVKRDDALMSEELFGPILAVVPVRDLDEAITFINSIDHALTVYIFSNNRGFKNTVLDRTRSGTASINETVMHVAANDAPFGGVGGSGTGYTTGKAGFDEFTHFRCTVEHPAWVEHTPLAGRYTPYDAKAVARMASMLRPRLPPRDGSSSLVKKLTFALGIAIAGALGAILTQWLL